MNRFRILTLALLLGVSLITKSQNTGPVAPEAMSFEPVDANNMVNMYTGDFSYVIPILHVPGPEGGYPIALSYHGGVTMDQEASWVGLGWNINPGAINRSVNGCPDDWNNKIQSTVGYIPSEEVNLYSIGVNVGLFDFLSVGVSYTWGAYRSVGINGGVFFGAEKSGEAGIGAGFSFDSHSGNVSASVNVGVRLGEQGMLGLSSNGSVNLGVFDQQSKMGAGFSISSQGISVSGKVNHTGVGFGISKQDNSSKDGWHQSTSGFSISIPIYIVTLSFSHQKLTYWYYRVYDDSWWGTLYTKNSAVGPETGGYDGIHDVRSKMDVYEIEYDRNSIKPRYGDLAKNNLILPAYDSYNATAQGLSGSFSPKYYSNILLCGDSYKVDADGYNEISYFHWWYAGDPDFNINPYFYFDNDISGYVQNLPGRFSATSATAGVQGVRYNNDTLLSSVNYNGKLEVGYVNKRRTTGNYIEWFSNEQIVSGIAKSKGFIDNNYIARTIKKDFDPDGIGGFMITSPDGKTYHYSIPVYQHEEFIRKNGSKSGSYSELRKLNSYAFTWLLTAITGPDFSDKNGDGLLNDGDYGYWVKFNYGKYTNGYFWQLPYDLEGSTYQNYKKEISFGRKEIYYLNSIETETHKALFVKQKRMDGSATGSAPISTGNYLVKTGKGEKLPPDFDDDNSYYYKYYEKYNYSFSDKVYPLKLDKIVLLTKKNLPEFQRLSSITENIGTLSISKRVKTSLIYCPSCCTNFESGVCGSSPYNPCAYDCSYMETNQTIEVVVPKLFYTSDDHLIMSSKYNYSNLKSNILKEVNFNYTYDLCGGTPNSDAPNKGKLTLKSIELLGRNGIKAMPAYIFNYHQPTNYYAKSYMDPFGYHKDKPESWSLKEITLPVGAKIRVDYEKNTFKNEAVYGNRIPIFKWTFNGNESKIKVAADIKSFKEGEVLNVKGLIEYQYPKEDTDPIDGGPTIVWPHSFIDFTADLTIKSISLSDSTITINSPSPIPPEENYEFITVIEGWLIDIRDNQNQYGGGIRVSKLTLVDELEHEYVTEYDYNKFGTTNSSGTVPYSIYYLDKKYVPYITELPSSKVVYGNVTLRQRSNGHLNPAITAYEFESYENVKSEDQFSLELEGQFKVINHQEPRIRFTYQTGDHHGDVFGRSTTLWNNFGAIGRLKSVKSLNPDGQLQGQVIHTYYDPSEIQIGLQQETYNTWKRYASYYNNKHQSYNTWNFTATSRVTFPSLAKSVITESAGQRREVTNDVYDFNTGNVLSTLTTDYDGTQYRSDVLPAYKIDAYTEMGIKSLDPTRKNMLTQEAASISYIKDGDNWKPLGVGVQTWKNSWTDRGAGTDGNYLTNGNFGDISLPYVWRKHKTFAWSGSVNEDGTYGSDFTNYSTTDLLIAHWADFDANGVNGWKKTSEVKRYNRYSAPLEMVDINGKAASSITNLEASQIVATASNAGYDEFTHCGFEESRIEADWAIYGSNVKGLSSKCTQLLSINAPSYLNGNKQEAINAHTGNYYLKLIGGETGANNSGGPEIIIRRLNPSRIMHYIASVWVHKSSSVDAVYLGYESKVPIPGGGGGYSIQRDGKLMSSSNSIEFGDWKLFKFTYSIPDFIWLNNIKFFVDCKGSDKVAYIDDFRVQPVASSVNAYVYDPITDAVTHILNNDNIATKYEYDDAGRLKATYKETPNGFKKVSEHNQGYARPVENAIALTADVTTSTYITYNGSRQVNISATTTNNDVVDRTVNIDFTLDGIGTNRVTQLIKAKQTLQLGTQFIVPGVDFLTKTLKITGDINVQKTIQVDEIPPTLMVVEFTSDNGTVMQANEITDPSNPNNLSLNTVANSISQYCSASIRAVVKNVGMSGTFSNLSWYVNSTLSEDIGTITLGTGSESTFYFIFNGSKVGMNIVELMQGNVGLGNVGFYCTSGSNPPIEPPTNPPTNPPIQAEQ